MCTGGRCAKRGTQPARRAIRLIAGARPGSVRRVAGLDAIIQDEAVVVADGLGLGSGLHGPVDVALKDRPGLGDDHGGPLEGDCQLIQRHRSQARIRSRRDDRGVGPQPGGAQRLLPGVLGQQRFVQGRCYG